MTPADYDIVLSFDRSIASRAVEWMPADRDQPAGTNGRHLPDADCRGWTKIPGEIRRHLATGEKTGCDRTLRIFRLPAASLAELHAFMDWQRARLRYDIDMIRQRLDETSLLAANFSTTDHEATRFLGLARMSGGRNTTTRDKENNIVGLHLDTFDKAPMDRRHAARNRIAINAGTAPRYLLFVPCTAWRLVEIARRSGGSWADDAMRDHRTFVRSFFEHVAPPIFRIRLMPGEGYMAPTENMLHDGSSFCSDAEDLTLVWLGYFQRLPASGR